MRRSRGPTGSHSEAAIAGAAPRWIRPDRRGLHHVGTDAPGAVRTLGAQRCARGLSLYGAVQRLDAWSDGVEFLHGAPGAPHFPAARPWAYGAGRGNTACRELEVGPGIDALLGNRIRACHTNHEPPGFRAASREARRGAEPDRKSTRLNSSHL